MKNRSNLKFFLSVALVLLLSVVLNLTVLAEGECVIKLGDARAAVGEEVTLSLSISQNSGIAGLELWLEYDKDMLTPVSITANNAFGGRLDSNLKQSGVLSEDLDCVSIVWTTTRGNKIDGDLCYVTFLVKEGAEKYIPVTVVQKDAEDIFDNDFNNVNALVLSGKITVTDAQAADKTILSEKIEAAREHLSDERYTKDSIAYLSNVLEKARGLCESEDVSQEEIDNEIALIDEAIAELSVKTFYVNVESADNTNIAEGYKILTYGEGLVLDIVCDEGYEVDFVTLNALEIYGESIVIDSINENYVICIGTKKIEYTVDAEECENGQIMVEKTFVKHGESCTVTFVPDEGYIVSDVMLDNVSIGAHDVYEIENIISDCVIGAVFELEESPKTVTATAMEGGSISPVKSIVNNGSAAVFVVTPKYGYEIRQVRCGNEIFEVNNNIVIIPSVTEDMEIEALFDKVDFNVWVNASVGGRAVIKYESFEGSRMAVTYLDEVLVEISPEVGYELRNVFVNNTAVKASVKTGGKLVYEGKITKDTNIEVTFIKDAISLYRDKVEFNGVPDAVTRENAREKVRVFNLLKEEYNKLTEEERLVAANSYGQVLAVLDRANAYIQLEESGIENCIDALPDTITEENCDLYADEINGAKSTYDSLTVAAKSLVSYQRATKLRGLFIALGEIKSEEEEKIAKFDACMAKLPEVITKENVGEAYAELKGAEEIYSDLGDKLNNERVTAMKEAASHILAVIHNSYIAPLTSKVNSMSVITPSDDWATAEVKRAQIFAVVNEYDLLPSFAKALVDAETVTKIDDLFKSASVTVSAQIGEDEVEAVGDIDVTQTLTITESGRDVTDAVGDGSVDKVLDIKLYENDTLVQPKGKIMIKVPVDDIVAEGNPVVVYVDDFGNAYDVQARLVTEKGQKYLVWTVDHFSSFAIVFEEENLAFDKDMIKAGETITAKVGGRVDMTDCTLFCAGYTVDNRLEFVAIGEDGKVSVTPTAETVKVKAFVWRNLCEPVECVTIVK